MIRRLPGLLAATAAALALLGSLPAAATNIQIDPAYNGVKICDAVVKTRCLTVAADGSISTSGGSSSLSAKANAASQTSVEGATTDPLSMDLHRSLRILNMDSAGNVIDPNAAMPPGENHLGEVGGNQISVQVTPTTTAVAFTAGWAIGGLQTVANAGRVTGGTGLLQSVEAFLKSNQTSANAAIDVFLFSDTTLSSTCTNAAAFVLSASDWAKLIGVVHLTDTTAGNTTTLVQAGQLAKPYNTAATSLYACAVARGTPTWGTTTDATLRFDFARN